MSEEAQELQRKFCVSVLESAFRIFSRNEDPELREVARDLEPVFGKDGPVQKLQAKMSDSLFRGAALLIKRTEIRSLLRKYPTANAGRANLSLNSLGISYRQDSAMGAIVVVLNNKTGRTLHHCGIVAQVNISPVKWREAKLHNDARSLPGYALMRLMVGDNDDFNAWENSTKTLEDMTWFFELIDKGTHIYVPEWKPGTKLEVFLAPPFAVTLGASAELAIWSDEAFSGPVALPLQEIKKAMK